MKFFRRIILFSLMIILTFTLVGCGNGEEVKDLQARIDELLAEAGQADATLRDTQTLLNDVQAARDALEAKKEALEEIMLDLVDNDEIRIPLIASFAKAGLLDVKSYEWTNLDALLDQLEKETKIVVDKETGEEEEVETGFYLVDVGFSFDTEFKVVVEAGEDSLFAGLEIEEEFTGADFVGFDYFWATTYDYNNGIEFDKEGKLTFKLPGYYGLAFFTKDQDIPDYYAQYIEEWVDEDDVPEDVDGKYTFLYFAIAPGAQLLTADENLSLEIKAGATNQLAINKPDKYTVVSYTSGDTGVFTVSATGLVTAVAAGKSYVEAVVKEGEVETTISMPVTVFVAPTGVLAGGTEGAFLNLKNSTVEQKAKILAYMERYLLNRGASIPVFNNSGLVIYSERVNFIAEEYVAQMGFGPTAVPMEGNQIAKGTEADPAYRMWTSANPSTLNHLAYADSIESDFLSLLEGSLFSFDWKTDSEGVGIGWNIKPEMAKRLAYPVTAVDGVYTEMAEWDGLTASEWWRIDIREDLKWQNGDDLNVDDFIYTFKEALNGELAYRRANLFTGGSLPIFGAKEYYDAKGTASWDSVGIKQIDEYSFAVRFKNAVPQWDVIYNWGGFIFTPIHKETYEANKATYGTSMERFMASGPYKLSYWEAGKEYRFTKNDNYFAWEAEEVDVRRPLFENFSYTIVKDNNAALALFNEGKLDVTSVPASAYDEFKTWPNQKFTPGATSFRLSVNRLTQAESDIKFGKGAWETKPILQEDSFMWALYFGMDREGVQAITKTSTAWSSYFTNAYSLVSSTATGTEIETYRMTDWGHAVYEEDGVFEGDIDLDEEGLGYNQALATAFYVAALDSLFDKGEVVQGSVANPTKITIEVAHFDGVVQEAVWGYVVQKYNELFNNTTKYGKTVIFEAISAPQPGMDVYYVKQMTGQYDLAQAGISGGTLDPVGFLETFCDDNRSGLLLSLGFDTHNANILIDLDLDGDGDDDGAMWWSFDALYSAFNGKTFIKEGKEAVAPKEPAE